MFKTARGWREITWRSVDLAALVCAAVVGVFAGGILAQVGPGQDSAGGCPAGQMRRAGRCITPPRPCLRGQHREGGQCVWDPCPTGQHREGRECVWDPCPTGQHREGSTCVWDPCPTGQHREGTACVLDPCPQGQRRIGTRCIPNCPYYDSDSNLCWQDPPNDEAVSWSVAARYCQNLSLSGRGPGQWRLPTISELRSLIRGCSPTALHGACSVTDSCRHQACQNGPCDPDSCASGRGPATGGCYWPSGLRGECSNYWSSVENRNDGSEAWFVYFGEGAVRTGPKNGFHRARCVFRVP